MSCYLLQFVIKMLNFWLSWHCESAVDPVWRVVHPGGQLVHDSAVPWSLYVPMGQFTHSQLSWSSNKPVPHPEIIF